jgi:uncharacterized protein (UPF0264 family)
MKSAKLIAVVAFVSLALIGGAVAGAVSVSEGVWMYQLTDKGLALELMAKGSKYYKDDDLSDLTLDF